jgi:hypothetical protein
MNLNVSREWLLRMADQEGNGSISAGLLIGPNQAAQARANAMNAPTEAPLRRTIKDLIEAGEQLAVEIHRVADYYPERAPIPPEVLMQKIVRWYEAVKCAEGG